MLHRMLVVCVALGLLVAFLGTDVAVSEEKVTVVGLATACGEDCEHGCPATVLTADEVLYRVTNDDKGKRLAREADGCNVEVKGTLAEKDGERWISVDTFKILEEEEEEEE